MLLLKLVVVALVLVSSVARAAWPSYAHPFARAVLSPKSGSKVIGTVDFAKDANRIRVRATVANLTPGKHGFHIHESGDCSADDGSTAGEHYNPSHAMHGGPGSLEHHLGDFGNLTAGKNGIANLEVEIVAGDDIIGKSIIIHEKADDLRSQPSGNSGKRIACGTILKTDARAE
jgi:Cu-Zn family superoxide dismutase